MSEIDVVFDIEANGLLDTVDIVHCIVAKDVNTREEDRSHGNGVLINLASVDSLLNTATKLIGHNILGYDLKALKKVCGWSPMLHRYRPEDVVSFFDTYIMSMLLNPNRTMPEGCPKFVINQITGEKKKIGPHSLAAWGYRLGRGKPEHDDWSVYSPGMMHRCVEDVEITCLVYEALLKEMKV